MPLLPPLPIFHSSSSSKSPKLRVVTRSSTGPCLESTPPATCQPAGSPGSFQPRQSGALWSCNSERQGPEATLAGLAVANSVAPQESTSTVMYRRLFMVHTGSGCLLRQVQLFEQLGGRSVETGQRHVAYVGQVLTANRS